MRLRHGYPRVVWRTSMAAGSPVFGTTRKRRDRGGTLSGSCVDSDSCPDPERVAPARLFGCNLHVSSS